MHTHYTYTQIHKHVHTLYIYVHTYTHYTYTQTHIRKRWGCQQSINECIDQWIAVCVVAPDNYDHESSKRGGTEARFYSSRVVARHSSELLIESELERKSTNLTCWSTQAGGQAAERRRRKPLGFNHKRTYSCGTQKAKALILSS